MDFFHKCVNALKRVHQNKEEASPIGEYSPSAKELIEAGVLKVPKDGCCANQLLEPEHEEVLRSVLKAIVEARKKSEE